MLGSKIDILHYKDIIIGPIVFAILAGIFLLGILPRYTDSKERRIIHIGFYLRMLGAIATAFLYQFYYGYGDTFSYYYCGTRYIEAWTDRPDLFVNLMAYGPENYLADGMNYLDHSYFFKARNRVVAKFAAVFGLITFKSFIGISLCMTFLSYIGSLLCYNVLSLHFPRHKVIAAVSCFLIPSVFFWGTGIMKESLVMMSLGGVIHGFYFLIKKKKMLYLVTCLISLFILFKVKVYLFAILLLSLALSYVFKRSTDSKYRIFKILTLLLISTVFLFSYQAIKAQFDISSADEALKKAAIIQKAQEHATTAFDGSGYQLGYVSDNWLKNSTIFLNATWTSIYRPFIWEAKKIVLIPAAIENLILLLLTITLIFRNKLKIFNGIRNDYFLLFMLIVSLCTFLVIGTISFNYGTLMRYRIPVLPFFVFILLYFLQNTSVKR